MLERKILLTLERKNKHVLAALVAEDIASIIASDIARDQSLQIKVTMKEKQNESPCCAPQTGLHHDLIDYLQNIWNFNRIDDIEVIADPQMLKLDITFKLTNKGQDFFDKRDFPLVYFHRFDPMKFETVQAVKSSIGSSFQSATQRGYSVIQNTVDNQLAIIDNKLSDELISHLNKLYELTDDDYIFNDENISFIYTATVADFTLTEEISVSLYDEGNNPLNNYQAKKAIKAACYRIEARNQANRIAEIEKITIATLKNYSNITIELVNDSFITLVEGSSNKKIEIFLFGHALDVPPLTIGQIEDKLKQSIAKMIK